MSMIGNMLGGFVKSVIMGQVRTYLPVAGGALAALGVNNQVNAASFEGSLYYLMSSAFVIIPAVFSYLQKKSVQTLVSAAIAAAPGTAEAAAITAKVS